MAENVLGTIFGRADALKRQLYDMIRNPSDYASMVGGRTQENLATAQALQNQAFGDPQNPLRITNPQALNQLTQMITSGPLGFAPAGVMNVTGLPNRGRDIIQSSAEDLSSKLRQLGFQADVTHSGSVAGPSSYVKVYDSETGRFFNQPIRFSGHSKGAFNQAEVRDVSDPTLDLPKIIEDALAMRAKGPSKLFQKQAIADELIAGGMKPKQAYSEAEQRVAGLLEPQAATKITREGSPIQSAVVLIGDKIFTGQNHGQALNRAIYEGVVKKEGNKYIYPKDAEVNMDLFMTKDGRIIDRLDAYKEFDIGASETASEKGLMQVKPASSMTVDEYITEAKKLKSLLE